MNEQRPRKGKGGRIAAGLIGLAAVFSIAAAAHHDKPLYVTPAADNQTAVDGQAAAGADTSAATPAVTVPAPSAPSPSSTPGTTSALSNNNYYTNSSGNEVHSPASTTDNSVPAGATAQCGDGTYSFSQHRSGTCSHHGGVARWL